MKGNKSYKRYRIRPFDVCNVLILGAFALLCMYPFYYLIIYSLSNSTKAARQDIWLFPADRKSVV
mgnify:FL=1